MLPIIDSPAADTPKIAIPSQNPHETNSLRGHNDQSSEALTKQCTEYYKTGGFYASRSWQLTGRALSLTDKYETPENKGKGCCASCTPYWQQGHKFLIWKNKRECMSGLICAVPSSQKDKKKGYCVAQNRGQEKLRQIKNIALSPLGAAAVAVVAGAVAVAGAGAGAAGGVVAGAAAEAGEVGVATSTEVGVATVAEAGATSTTEVGVATATATEETQAGWEVMKVAATDTSETASQVEETTTWHDLVKDQGSVSHEGSVASDFVAGGSSEEAITEQAAEDMTWDHIVADWKSSYYTNEMPPGKVGYWGDQELALPNGGGMAGTTAATAEAAATGETAASAGADLTTTTAASETTVGAGVNGGTVTAAGDEAVGEGIRGTVLTAEEQAAEVAKWTNDPLDDGYEW